MNRDQSRQQDPCTCIHITRSELISPSRTEPVQSWFEQLSSCDSIYIQARENQAADKELKADSVDKQHAKTKRSENASWDLHKLLVEMFTTFSTHDLDP